jgi:hypothetical protein
MRPCLSLMRGKFLTVIQLILPLHEFAAEPLHYVGDSATAESTADPLQFVANLDATKSVDEPLQSVADSEVAADALTETSCS